MYLALYMILNITLSILYYLYYIICITLSGLVQNLALDHIYIALPVLHYLGWVQNLTLDQHFVLEISQSDHSIEEDC